ncbi:MAG: hypothetical protein WD066_02410 [Planctomycetaceae bacterium]
MASFLHRHRAAARFEPVATILALPEINGRNGAPDCADRADREAPVIPAHRSAGVGCRWN